MHISQRALRSFVICFAILMLLPVAGTAIVGTGIVTLPLFFFTNTGALSCKPGNLWFGKVMVGGSNVLSARLSNTGTSNITISSVSVTGAGYSLSGLSFPMTLGPGNSAQFQVIFAPLVQGRVDGSIGFTHGHVECKPVQHQLRDVGAGQQRDATRGANKYRHGQRDRPADFSKREWICRKPRGAALDARIWAERDLQHFVHADGRQHFKWKRFDCQ